MIKNYLYKYIFSFVVLGAIQGITSNPLFAQDDFGYDLSVAGETKLAKGLKIEVEASMRTQDDAKKIDRYVVGAELSYRLFQTDDKKFDIKANAGFEYLWQNKLGKKTEDYIFYEDEEEGRFWGTTTTNKYWRNRFRINPGFSFSYTPNKRWSFSLKETVQYNHYNKASRESQLYRPFLINDDDDWITKDPAYEEMYKEPINYTITKDIKSKDRVVLRSKLSAAYDIKNFPIDIFASVEYGCGLNYTKNKWKYTAGYDYKIDKSNKISMYYRYNRENDEFDTNGHIIGLGYKFKF